MAQKRANVSVEFGGTDFEHVAVSQTDQVLGTAGAKGDFLARLVINTITVATAAVTLTDGTATYVIQTAASATLGPKSIDLGIRAVTGPWKITTGAGATVLAIGQFSVAS